MNGFGTFREECLKSLNREDFWIKRYPCLCSRHDHDIAHSIHRTGQNEEVIICLDVKLTHEQMGETTCYIKDDELIG